MEREGKRKYTLLEPFVTSAPLSSMSVHPEPLRMRTNVVYISELCEDCTVANEIDYA